MAQKVEIYKNLIDMEPNQRKFSCETLISNPRTTNKLSTRALVPHRTSRGFSLLLVTSYTFARLRVRPVDLEVVCPVGGPLTRPV